MKYTWILAGLLTGGFLFPTATWAQDDELLQRISALELKVADMAKQDDGSLRAYWKNGFILEQPDKSFKLQLGGRAQFDTAFFDAEEALEAEAGPFDDGARVRRARLNMRGTMYDSIDFMIEYDFASGGSFQSAYVGTRNVPVLGTVQVGHLLEPIGLEEIASNNHITFMERGSATYFNPIYNIGLMAFDDVADQRMTWAAGVFKDTDNDAISTSNETWAVSARLTGLPYATEDGRSYLHLGSSVSQRHLDDNNFYRIRARPGSAIAPYVVNTGNIDADQALLTGLESILTLGSFSLQSEYMRSEVDRLPGEETPDPSDVAFDTYYVMASYFLTGEHRPYNRKGAIPGRITPKQNASGKAWGAGAWELAVRFDRIDLTDDDVTGGEMESWTGGVNWYLNPHTRVMLDYTQADVEDTGTVDTLAMRFQVDF